ncbi:MAG TPA: hypothetical protein VFQ67_15425 [Allosphingosinicella sp.]|nr:hypothetical protein [Allosphingosinicella sp.]
MTASGARAMRDSAPQGEGERRDLARRRKRWLILAAIAVLGGVPAFYAGFQDGAAMAQSRPLTWSPTLAAVLAGLYLVVMVGGGLLMHGVTDELERQRGYKAASVAGLTLMLVYPTWFLLWRGGFVAEPVHWMLFVLFWLSLALASLFYRFR